MKKTPANYRRHWSSAEEKWLKDLIRTQTPVRVIANKMGRTLPGIRSKASELGKSLSGL